MTPMPPVNRFAEEMASDSMRAPSDYVRTNDVRGSASSTVLMSARWVRVEETGQIVCALKFRFAEEVDANVWLRNMLNAHVEWPLAPEDVVWFREGWPVDSDGRGLSVLEVDRLSPNTPSTRAAAA